MTDRGDLGVVLGALVRCDEALVATATELAESHDLSAYDAAYVADRTPLIGPPPMRVD